MEGKVGLYIVEKKVSDGKGYYHVTAHLVSINDVGTVGSLTEVGNLHTNDMRITCQGSNDDSPRHVYGWEIIYQPYTVDLQRAEKMARTLRAVTKKLEAQSQKEGHPESFGQYLSRVARALGATVMVFSTAGQRGWANTQYKIVSAGQDGISRVNCMISAWTSESTQKAPEEV